MVRYLPTVLSSLPVLNTLISPVVRARAPSGFLRARHRAESPIGSIHGSSRQTACGCRVVAGPARGARVGARPALAERHQPPCPWLQPDAPSASQRQAASAAAAVKRKAGAMPEAERKAKHAERNRLSRAAKKVKLAAAAADPLLTQ